MIWPTAAGKLALTKLKTRKIRLFITLIISSLLFSLILGVSFVTRGAVSGVEDFSKTGFGNRYLVSAASNNTFFNFFNDKKIIAQAESLQTKLQTQKTAEAKKLGLQYDPKTDVHLVDEYDSPQGKQKNLNMQVPQAAELVAKRMAALPGNLKDFTRIANGYGAKEVYSSTSLINFFNGPPYLQVLQDGKEDYNQQQGNPAQKGIGSLSSTWQLSDSALLRPFLLKGQSLKTGSDGSVPIVAPFSAAEQILGLKPLPSSAKPQARLERLALVRQRAAGYSFMACYRNQSSASAVQEAISQQQQIASEKGASDFQMPDLVMDKPKTACGSPVVTRDVRSYEAKKQADARLQFNQEFGQPKPESKLIKLRIVGLNADPQFGNTAINLADIFRNILTSSLGMGWYSPKEAAPRGGIVAKVFNLNGPTQALSEHVYYAEFNTPQQLKTFMDQQNCQPSGFGPNQGPDFDPLAKCREQKKYFSVQPYGSSSVALADFKKVFNKVFTIAALVAAAVAAIIMMGTVGRIIADSRRETAVFRAIGAKRSDIAQIYLTYVVILSLLVVAVSLALGLLAAHLVNHHYSETFSVDALLAFNVSDLSQRIVLIKFYARDVLYVVGLVVGVSILAALLPILNNARRNPIRDMRDER